MIIHTKKIFNDNRFLLYYLGNPAFKIEPTNGIILFGNNYSPQKFFSRINHMKEVIREQFKSYKNELKFSYETLKGGLEDPKRFKIAFSNLLVECRKYYKEKTYIWPKYQKQVEIDQSNGVIDIAFKFETENDLKNLVVNTDSDNDGGYTSASFKITPNKTGLLSGNLVTEVPKSGNIKYAGYANLMCYPENKSFNRPDNFDWRYYTHLVFKVRGDGRTWNILLGTAMSYSETTYFQYCHPLYTRGGPYWQITKIPFSHFFFAKATKISDGEEGTIPQHLIRRLGLTLADTNDGPFKLEIDYIGLEKYQYHNEVTPYESYAVPHYT